MKARPSPFMLRCAAGLIAVLSVYVLTGEFLLTLSTLLLAAALSTPMSYGTAAILAAAASAYALSGWTLATDTAGAALLVLGLVLWTRGANPVLTPPLEGRLGAFVRRRARIIAAAACLIATALLIAAAVRGMALMLNLAAAAAWIAVARSVRRESALPGFGPRRVLATALVSLSMLALVLALVELGARALIAAPLPSPHRSEIWAHHPRAWWAPAAGLNTTGIYRDSPGSFREFDVELSTQGLRGPEIGPKRLDELRVLVAGDSYTFGWSMPEGKDFASILRSELAQRAGGRPVTVVNCSAIGYGPWQERILIEERGLPLEPDVVILQLYPANDGWNTLAKFGRALPSYGPRMEEFVAYWRDYRHWVVRTETWLRRHSLAYHAYRTGLRGQSFAIPDALSRLRWAEPYNPPPLPRRNGRPPMIEQCLVEWYPDLQAGWDEMEKDVLGIVELCRERRVPVIVYALPFPLIEKDAWDAYVDAVAAQAGPSAHYEQFRDVRAAEAFLKSSGIPFIPVLDPLLAETGPDSYFIPNDGHLNEAGARFVSGLIADRLERERLLPAGAPGDSEVPQRP